MFIARRSIVVPIVLIVAMIVLSACGLSSSSSIQQHSDADRKARLASMNETAERMYQLAKERQFPEAREQLEKLSIQMTQLTYNGLTTPDGLNAFTELVTDARHLYNRIQLPVREATVAAAQIKLAVDALHNKAKPLWLSYSGLLRDDAQQLAGAVEQGQQQEAFKAFERFYSHYKVIRPAILISRPPQTVQKADSWFVYMRGLLAGGKIADEQAQSGARLASDLVAELFEGKEAATLAGMPANQKPMMWASMLLAAIIAVLSYVGWKKYKYGV